MKAIQNSTQTLYFKKNTTSWTQPKFTQNSSMTGTSPAVSYGYTPDRGQNFGDYLNPYLAFSPNNGYIGIHSNEGTKWGNIVLYFPDSFMATSLYLSNTRNDAGKNYMSGLYYLSFAGSDSYYSNITDINDDSNWTILLSGKSIGWGKSGSFTFENSNKYKYYRIKGRPGTSAYNDGCSFSAIKIGGTQECYEPCSQEEATVSKIVPAYKLGYREGKYWGLG